MLRTKGVTGLVLVGLILSGCSIKQNIEPAELQREANLCIVENKKVRETFLQELLKVIDEKGIAYEVIAPDSAGQCEWKVIYTANWSWDLALYMSYVRIAVYQNGTLDGEAIYDSTSGGANMSKFINAGDKIKELVDQLMKYKTASAFFNKFFG